MIFIKELYYTLKRNTVLMGIYVVLLTTFLVLLNIFVSFNGKIDDVAGSLPRNFSDKTMYSLIDTLEPDDFEAFNRSADSVEIIADFYNELNKQKEFSYLALNDQPIPIIDFKGNETFEYAYGTPMNGNGRYEAEIGGKTYPFSDVKAIQLNKKSFDFYSLEVAEGEGFNWNELGYDQKTIPVLMGSDYKSIYDLGEIFSGDYLFELVSFKVVGFLKDSSFIFYQGNAEYYLDNILLIPYPQERLENNFNSEGFLNRLYFGMINGNIATNKDMEISDVLNKLNKIGEKTNFKNYHILGVSSFVEQYTDMLLVLTANKELIVFLFSVLFILMGMLLLFISYLSFMKRKRVYYNYYLNGYSKRFVCKLIMIETFFPIVFSTIPYFISLFMLEIGSNSSLIIMAVIPMILGTLTSFFLVKIVLERQLFDNFRRERC